MEQTIDLRKKREFGEIFNATTIFLKQEYKLLGKTFLFYVLPVALVLGIMSALNQATLMRNMTELQSGNYNTFSVGNLFSKYAITYLIMLVNQVVLISFLFSYMKLYLEKGSGNFNERDIFEGIKSVFLKVFLALFVVGFISIIGLFLCVIPGIFLSVSLSVIFCIMIFEDKSFGESFLRSFELTRLQWWWTFLIIFVSYLVVSLISYILALPMVSVGILAGLHSLKDPSAMSTVFTPFVTAYTVLLSLVTAVLYLIPLTVIAFQYFNLVEIKERPSLLGKIDQITNDEASKSE